MGIGIRVFIVEDDDRLRRISERRFEGLRRDDLKTKQLPEYANRKIRYVLVGLSFEGGKLQEIVHANFGYLCFDENGRFDKEFREQEKRAVVETIASLILKPKKREDNVIEADRIFNKKRRDHEFSWTPTHEINKAVVDAIFPEKAPIKKPPLRLV